MKFFILLLMMLFEASISVASSVESKITFHIVDPIMSNWILPDSELDDLTEGKPLAFTATPGEYESGSVVFHANDNLYDLTLEISDLSNDEGMVIPADNMDAKLVKCWIQYGRVGWEVTADREAILVPELLLNDSRLVAVDAANQFQAVRMGEPGSLNYRNLEDPGRPYGERNRSCHYSAPENRHLEISENPIYDAATLQPFNVNKNSNQQLHFRLYIPEDTPAGIYSGTIAVSGTEMVARDKFHKDAVRKNFGEIAVEVEVLPFILESPKTNYDFNENFTPSIYFCTLYAPWRAEPGICPSERDLKQYELELADLKAHGITNPLCFQMDKWDLDAFREVLRLRKKTGMDNRPLYSMPESNLHCGSTLTAENEPLLKQRIDDILQVVEEELGHRDVYFYGIDESSQYEQEFPIWKKMHEFGAKTFVSDCKYPDELNMASAPGNIIDLIVRAWIPEPEMKTYAKIRHDNNGKVWCYGMPQGGVENPAYYRRYYGVLCYFSDYDGFATYCYYEAFGHPWNDLDHYYRDHNMVYPTANGIVGTLQWEGMREAVDDIRYLTTLRREMRKNADNPYAAELIAEAEQFLNNINPLTCDLEQVRSRTIDLILRLMDLTEAYY